MHKVYAKYAFKLAETKNFAACGGPEGATPTYPWGLIIIIESQPRAQRGFSESGLLPPSLESH